MSDALLSVDDGLDVIERSASHYVFRIRGGDRVSLTPVGTHAMIGEGRGEDMYVGRDETRDIPAGVDVTVYRPSFGGRDAAIVIRRYHSPESGEWTETETPVLAAPAHVAIRESSGRGVSVAIDGVEVNGVRHYASTFDEAYGVQVLTLEIVPRSLTVRHG